MISSLIGFLPSGMELIFILARPQPMDSTLSLLGPFIAVSHLLVSSGIEGFRGPPGTSQNSRPTSLCP